MTWNHVFVIIFFFNEWNKEEIVYWKKIIQLYFSKKEFIWEGYKVDIIDQKRNEHFFFALKQAYLSLHNKLLPNRQLQTVYYLSVLSYSGLVTLILESCFCSDSRWGWSYMKTCLGHPRWLLHFTPQLDRLFRDLSLPWPLYEARLGFLIEWWSKVNFKWLLVSPITWALRPRQKLQGFLWLSLRCHKSSPLLHSYLLNGPAQIHCGGYCTRVVIAITFSSN